MARVRKPQPTYENLLFSSPEQKVLRFLLSEPTSSFTPRVISSKLKGVRGLGGTEGILKILRQFSDLGLVEFIDNERSVRLRDECCFVQAMKTVGAICDLEGLRKQLEPISNKIILFGSRASGKARTDSDYDLFVVTEAPDDAREIASRHPLGKLLEVLTFGPESYDALEKDDPGLAEKISRGIVLWGSAW